VPARHWLRQVLNAVGLTTPRGLAFLPLYAPASACSSRRTGHPFSHNVVERAADLADGGSPP
jgi:hypothetical protein